MVFDNLNGGIFPDEDCLSRRKRKCLMEAVYGGTNLGKEIEPGKCFSRISQTPRELADILPSADAVLASSTDFTRPHFNSSFELHELIIRTHVKLIWYSIFKSMKAELATTMDVTTSTPEFFAVVDAMYPAIEEGTPPAMNVEYLDKNWASNIPIEVFLNVAISLLEDDTCFPSPSTREKVEGFLLAVMKEVAQIYSTKFGKESLTHEEQEALLFFGDGRVLTQLQECGAISNSRHSRNSVGHHFCLVALDRTEATHSPLPVCPLRHDFMLNINFPTL